MRERFELALQPPGRLTGSPELTPRFPSKRLSPSVHLTTNNPLADVDSPVRDPMSSIDSNTIQSGKDKWASGLSLTPMRHMVPSDSSKLPVDTVSLSEELASGHFASADGSTMPLLRQRIGSGFVPAPDFITPPHMHAAKPAPQHQSPLATTRSPNQLPDSEQLVTMSSGSSASPPRRSSHTTKLVQPSPQLPRASTMHTGFPARPKAPKPHATPTRAPPPAGASTPTARVTLEQKALASDLARKAVSKRAHEPIQAGGPTLDQLMASDEGQWGDGMYDTMGDTHGPPPASAANGQAGPDMMSHGTAEACFSLFSCLSVDKGNACTTSCAGAAASSSFTHLRHV